MLICNYTVTYKRKGMSWRSKSDYPSGGVFLGEDNGTND